MWGLSLASTTLGDCWSQLEDWSKPKHPQLLPDQCAHRYHYFGKDIYCARETQRVSCRETRRASFPSSLTSPTHVSQPNSTEGKMFSVNIPCPSPQYGSISPKGSIVLLKTPKAGVSNKNWDAKKRNASESAALQMVAFWICTYMECCEQNFWHEFVLLMYREMTAVY